jgi:hypothetical protein
LLRPDWVNGSEKNKSKQPKETSLHGRILSTAMDMPQESANENQYFWGEKVKKTVAIRLRGVADLIRWHMRQG